MRGPTRPAAVIVSLTAILCSLAPPIAYAVAGPRIPFAAFLKPSGNTSPSAPRPGAPVVLDIYRGAWEHGSPQSNAQFDAIIRSWGYRVIALNYPHAPGARWPAQREAILHEIDALPAGRIVVLGHSSGAQLAIIAAALRPHRITGVITYESPVDHAFEEVPTGFHDRIALWFVRRFLDRAFQAP
ncbi:MAG: alpha/beta fold hydrolase [Candidatus Tumulicola sp.]